MKKYAKQKNIYLFILHLNLGLSSILFSHSFPHHPFASSLNPLLLCIHSEQDRPPMGICKTWHIKGPLHIAPPSVFRLGKTIQHEA